MFEKIRATIETAFATWAAAYPASVAWPNVDFDPTGITSPWVLPKIMFSGKRRSSITGVAATGHEYAGSLVVDIFLPPDSGNGPGMTMLDSLTTAFCEHQFAVSGVTWPVVFASDVDAGSVGDGDSWQQLSWSCPFALDKL